jgi:Uri superfamily endonuclease
MTLIINEDGTTNISKIGNVSRINEVKMYDKIENCFYYYTGEASREMVKRIKVDLMIELIKNRQNAQR